MSPLREAARNASTTSRAPDAAAGTACKLARRLRRTADDRRDLLKGQVEHVVKDEGDAFGGLQRVEHDQQRDADRVGEHGFLVGRL